jgi:quercetin dioxygenase-like cupin family protein
MTEQTVTRTTLAQYLLPHAFSMKQLEVRRITMAPNLAAGAHQHNGPVFGVIEKGSAFVQVGTEEIQRLDVGEVFYEPAEQVITKFDATEEGLTFLGWFPLLEDTEPEISML